MDWDSLIGGLMSSPLILLVLAVVGKLWPDAITSFCTWMYSHVDPRRLPYGSAMNRHWEEQRELEDRVNTEFRELRKDVVKNTIIMLMNDRESDHSEAVRYELAKLDAMDSQCWVVDAAKEYVEQHIREKTESMEGTNNHDE